MAHEFWHHRMVEFVDCDMAGILHFSNYFRYMEAAEHAFFRSLGLSVHSGNAEGASGAARRTASCSYERPLRYEDLVDLHVLVVAKGRSSISYRIDFYRRNGHDGARERVARGEMTVVFVQRLRADGTLRAVAIPLDVAASIEPT